MPPPLQTDALDGLRSTSCDLPRFVIYIAGYGRSGSTALDISLGHHLGAISLGELSELGTEILRSPAVRCGCGCTYGDCPVWGKIADDTDYASRQRSIVYHQAHPLAKLALGTLWSSNGATSKDQGEIVADILRPFREVAQHFPKAICIDSSKTAWLTARRPQVLSAAGLNVAVIHIQRSLFGVIKSVRKGGNKKLAGIEPRDKIFRTFRAVIAYFFANHSAKLLARRFPYLHVKQEDFLRAPEETVARIIDYLTPFIQNSYIQYSEQHIVAGNRLKSPTPQ